MRALWPLLLVAACEKGPEAQRCHLGQEREIARSSSKRLRAIALAAGARAAPGPRLLAAWSDEDGVTTAILDGQGRIVAGPRHDLEQSVESLDAIGEGDGYRLAALVPADLFAGGGGAASHDLDAAALLTASRALGPSGAYSKRISIAPGAVAWHDGGPGTFVVRASTDGTSRHAVEVARGSMGALSPSIAAAPDGSFAIAWAELKASSGGAVGVPVMFRRFSGQLEPRGPASTVARVVIEGADPFLLWRDGGFTIAYRDVRDGDRRAGYYLARIGRRGDARIGRGNGPLGPDIVHCHGLYAGATVRTHAHELLLGFNRFDVSGKKRGGELQIFSDRVHFGTVELECLPDGYALLYGEEDEQRGARLLYNRVTCDD
ncbi:MAG: hypothetical protein HYY06_12555 [Deltaproteobacteria bacterium]|nr:hypothetical protein [Deltaproteobacteria bacterium]